MLRCRTCKARFSERKGTPLFGSRLPQEKVGSVLEHIAEGCGVRQTGGLLGPSRHRNALQPLAGDHARAVHDELVAFSPRTREVQFDEKWSFVAKKEKHCDPTDPADDHKGDNWDHVAFDAEHRLVVSVVPGADGREHRGVGRGFQAADGGPADEPDHQRRISGLPAGDFAGLRQEDHAAPHGQAGPAQGPV